MGTPDGRGTIPKPTRLTVTESHKEEEEGAEAHACTLYQEKAHMLALLPLKLQRSRVHSAWKFCFLVPNPVNATLVKLNIGVDLLFQLTTYFFGRFATF